ncbi:MAG: TolC family protein [Pseudomonadota bacterium]|nr:TolC family protein [Pseudomonadota bacterium]
MTSGQAPNPQLTLGAGSVGRNLGAGSFWNKTFDHSARVDQTIERGGKPVLRRAVAEAQREAARADLAEAQRRARLAAAQQYHELVATLGRAEEAASALSLAGQAQRAQELRVKTGDVAPVEAIRLNLDAIRVQADLRQSEADARSARNLLATMLGVEIQAGTLTPSGFRLDAAAAEAASVAFASAGQRPDVVAAEHRLKAAQDGRALARALQARDVSVGLQFDRWPVSATNTSGTGNTVSVSVSVPLLIRHAYEGEAARAEADVNSALEVLRRARASAASDLLQAQTHWASAAARRRLAGDELMPAAERVAAAAEFAYRRGSLSLLDVLDARRNLRSARLERINAEADAAKAAAELEAATFTQQ